VTAGVDLRAAHELGAWWSLSMVQRSGHPSPGHLAAAGEKIVTIPAVRDQGAAEPGLDLDPAAIADRADEVRDAVNI
jgi:hypothetical protein